MPNKSGIKGILRINDQLLRIIAFILLGCLGMNDASSMQNGKNKLMIHIQNKQRNIEHQLFTSADGSSQYPADISSKSNQIYQDNIDSIYGDSSAVVIDNDNNLLEQLFRTPMSFGTENSTTVITQIGATAHLPCVVHFIGEGVVSWIRRKDYHLLTVALTTYSSDERFSATHLKNSEDWTLQIKYVQLRDAGIYECQVSTHPPTSIFIHLNIIEARAEILGPSVKYLTPDSTLRLICRIIQSTETSAFLFWYHDDRMINYDMDGGVHISTEADYHYSELKILHASKKHSGNYSCVPSNAQPASVVVHIFKGDNPAAMHHDHLNGGGAATRTLHKKCISLVSISLLVVLVPRDSLNFFINFICFYIIHGICINLFFCKNICKNKNFLSCVFFNYFKGDHNFSNWFHSVSARGRPT